MVVEAYADSSNRDAAVGGNVGGAAGAAIGNEVGGRDGAIVGRAPGRAIGAVIFTDDDSRHTSYKKHTIKQATLLTGIPVTGQADVQQLPFVVHVYEPRSNEIVSLLPFTLNALS